MSVNESDAIFFVGCVSKLIFLEFFFFLFFIIKSSAQFMTKCVCFCTFSSRPHPLHHLKKVLNPIREKGVLCLFLQRVLTVLICCQSSQRVHKTSLAGTDLCLHSVARWYDFQQ